MTAAAASQRQKLYESIMLFELFVCFMIADFLTGLFHWLEDTYGLPTWPVLGSTVVEPNIEHHRTPGLIGRMGTWITRNVQPLVLAIAGTSLLWLAGWRNLSVLLVGLLAALGNEVHCWSHRKQNPRWIRWLQSAGLVQSPRQHALHHIAPFDRYYCTLGNLMNELLELVRFWRVLEWAIACAGISVKRGDPRRGGF